MNEIMTQGDTLTTSAGTISQIYYSQKTFFASGVTLSYAFRKGQLNVLKAAIKRNEPAIIAALKKDLNKSEFEAYGTEIGVVYEEINDTLKHLRMWMQPERVSTPLLYFPSSSIIHKDPLGVVLIISPWNYPFMLLMAPLIAAIAGGNTALLKPSEMAGATEAVLFEMISQTFEEEYIAVIKGPGHLIGPQLIIPHQLNHIFFTGSTAVGKKIMEAAATHLTPVTLELGGKSPCIVAPDAKLDFAAKKIAWSKWTNAGQTCVAPDYLLVHESIKEKIIAKLVAVTEKMFGQDPKQSIDYPRMINKKRFEVMEGYLKEVNIIYGGETDLAENYIEPSIVEINNVDSACMKEEIFGPILPVITYHTNEEALAIINQFPQPLSFYLFTETRATETYFINKLPFGGGCINNGLIHLGNPALPFGGVGYSGMGQYHGKAGFETFSRKKSIVKTPSWFDVPVWYAPYKNNVRFLRKLLK